MNIFTCALLTTLLLSSTLLPYALAAPPTIERQMEIIEATIEGGDIATVDPAAAYDTASGELLMNMYDTLVFLDGEHMDRYLPSLAANWTIVQNNPPVVSTHTGLNFYYTYYFKIRTGVQWQNPSFGNVTTADVEYTFERGMVLEPGDDPQWMFYEPLLNGATMTYINGQDKDPEGSLTDRTWVGWAIDEAVESNSTHVWFNLAFPGAYTPLLQILSQQWSSIISKTWCNDLRKPSNWDGDWGVDHTAYYAYHFPSVPPLDNPEPAVMGTGPFVLEELNNSLHKWSGLRNHDYWRGWPLNWPGFGSSKPAGYIERFTVTWTYDWNTRSTMFLNGEVDFCAVPRQYLSQMQDQPGIRCMYSLPSLSVDVLCFQFDINSTSPYGPILPPGTFNESGVPSDFFGNPSWGIHARKAFTCAIDYESFIGGTYLGEAVHPATAIIPVLPHYCPSIEGYNYNLSRAAEELQQIPGLWEIGFTVKFLYWMASMAGPLQRVVEQMSEAINSLNPKFHTTAVGLTWASYLYASGDKQLPVFPASWYADYPDPHNLAYPYYHSRGNFASREGYNSSAMDALVDLGISQMSFQEREATYGMIQQLVIDDCPSAALATMLRYHFERTWVCGWYCNPIYPGQYYPTSPGVYAANLWKWYYTPHAQLDTVTNATANLLPYDVNYDGKTNMVDIGRTAASFGSIYGPPISPKWNFRCDFNNDRKIDMKDIGGVAQNFGKTSPPWSPPP